MEDFFGCLGAFIVGALMLGFWIAIGWLIYQAFGIVGLIIFLLLIK